MKVLKITIASLVAILLIGAGAVYYYLEIKDYEIAEDDELDQIVKNPYSIELPNLDEDEEEITEEEEATTEASTDVDSTEEGANSPESTESSNGNVNGNSGTNGSSSSSNQNTSSNSSNSSNGTQKRSAESIIERYVATFETLEEQANDKINDVVKRAFNEYEDMRKNSGKVSYGYFYNKYYPATKDLEYMTDEAFYYVYGELQNALNKNGYDPNLAVRYKNHYENTKDERRKKFLNIARERLL